ncbi:transcriptional regulator FilR1 domain-containing protein, partial [Methanolobus sp.]|uniref:helix-turn-helix transcriptional regulator n=1 Tax=Methanolobus sp. TaxID=1874737 RepID=UPI0025D3BCAC
LIFIKLYGGLIAVYRNPHNCEIISPNLINMYEINKDFIETIDKSESVYLIFTFVHPSFPPIISKLVENNTNVSIIITKELLRKIKSEKDGEFISYFAFENIKFYLYDKDINMVSFALSDYCLILRLLSKNNEYDNKQLSFLDSKALLWGKNLFDYYLKDTVPIIEI